MYAIHTVIQVGGSISEYFHNIPIVLVHIHKIVITYKFYVGVPDMHILYCNPTCIFTWTDIHSTHLLDMHVSHINKCIHHNQIYYCHTLYIYIYIYIYSIGAPHLANMCIYNEHIHNTCTLAVHNHQLSMCIHQYAN